MKKVEYYVLNNDLLMLVPENKAEKDLLVKKGLEIKIVENLLNDGAIFNIVGSRLGTMIIFLNKKGEISVSTNNKNIQNEKSFLEKVGQTFILALNILLNKKHYSYLRKQKNTKRIDGKKIKGFSKVTYITNKIPPVKDYNTHSNRKPIGHKFLSRGHWRPVKGIGKNYNGEYVEVGRTWVKESIKGQGELIIKPRIIKN